MVRKLIILCVLLYSSIAATAKNDSLSVAKEYSHKHDVWTSILNFVKDFGEVDTNYVEPQRYNFTVMLQSTNTYELYRVGDNEGNSLVLAPKMTYKLGPYFGWRWVFFGYTVDLKHVYGHSKKELDLSIYTNKIGVDLFYKKTGNDYRIRRMYFKGEGYINEMRNVNFSGFHASIKGFNLYYIVNNKKFSYPAAFSQSTVQRRSCGSLIVGASYTRHKLSIDWEDLYSLMFNRMDKEKVNNLIKPTLVETDVVYNDYSASVGYGYNWVFARNWLAAASLSVGIGYKQSKSEQEHERFSLRDFALYNFNLDGVGRFGIVWNNTRWYAGVNTILHAYNSRDKEFSTNNVFGNLNIYVGFNFNRR